MTSLIKFELGKILRNRTLNEKKLTKYFPKNYTSEDVEKVIESLLEKWKQEQEVM